MIDRDTVAVIIFVGLLCLIAGILIGLWLSYSNKSIPHKERDEAMDKIIELATRIRESNF